MNYLYFTILIVQLGSKQNTKLTMDPPPPPTHPPTENLNCDNEKLWNKKTPYVPKVPPRDENYRKVLHKTVDDQNVKKFILLSKVSS